MPWARGEALTVATACAIGAAALSMALRPAGIVRSQSGGLAWLNDSTWHWNRWSDVQLLGNGTFVAQNCAGDCRWWAEDGKGGKGDKLKILWGGDGLHTMRLHGHTLRGKRNSDGDRCSATLVSRAVFVQGQRLPSSVEQLLPYFFRGESDLRLSLLAGVLGLAVTLFGLLFAATHASETDAAAARSRQVLSLAAEMSDQELDALSAKLSRRRGAMAEAAASPQPANDEEPIGHPVLFCSPRQLAQLLSWLLPGCIYYTSTAPDVCLVDAGALTLAAAGPGVAHPPGFPLWTFLGWVTAQMPGRVIRNVNLLSAASATALCHLLWRLSRRWVLRASVIGASGSRHRLGPLVELGPLAGSLLAGLSFPVWGFATFAEVYHVTSACLVASILVTCQWRDDAGGGDDRQIALAGLLFGLAGCSHHITAALALPAMIYLAASRPANGVDGSVDVSDDQQLTASSAGSDKSSIVSPHLIGASPATHENVNEARWRFYAFLGRGVPRQEGSCDVDMWSPWWMAVRNVSIAALGALLPGLVFYSSIYVIGRRHPLWNWGGVDDAQKWWWHVSGKQYQVNLGQFRMEHLLLESMRIGWLCLTSYTPVGLAVAAWGSGVLRHAGATAERTTLAVLLAVSVGFAFCYEIAEDKEGYYVTASWVVGIGFAVGASDVLRRARAHSMLAAFVAVLLISAAPALVFVLNEGGCDRASDVRGPLFVKDIVAPIPQGGLLLTQEWQFYAPWLALHHLDGFRPDLTIIDVNLVRRFWYLDYLEAHAPRYMNKLRKPLERYKANLYLFDHDMPYDTAEIHSSFIDLLNGFIDVHLSDLSTADKGKTRSAYVMTPMEQGVGDTLAWEMQGLVHNVRKEARPPEEKRPSTNVDESATRWIRHAWDIEGSKLHQKYVGALESHWRAAEAAAETKRARHLRKRLDRLGAVQLPFNGI